MSVYFAAFVFIASYCLTLLDFHKKMYLKRFLKNKMKLAVSIP